MVLMDPWANLRGVPVHIYERCGANTRTKIGTCQNERDLCGLHPRVRRFPYKRDRNLVRAGRPDGRTERARRNREELQRALAEERRQLDREAYRRIQHSNPPETPGSARDSRPGEQLPPSAREPTRGPERQPPAQEPAPPDLSTDGPLPDDGSPEVTAITRWLGFPTREGREGFRSARLRHLNPGGGRPSERQWSGPDDEPPDGDGEPLPEAI